MATATNDPPDPLRFNVPIVSLKDGTPTQEFLRQWNRQRAVNITVDDVTVDLTALEDAVVDIQDVDIVAGVGLSGGGNISGPSNVTIDLEDTAVTPGTYGSATNVPQITIDQQGRITDAVNVPISGGSGSGGGGGNWTLFEARTISSPTANEDFTGLGSYSEILIIGYLVTSSASSNVNVRVSTDNGSSFYSTSGDYAVVNTGASLTNVTTFGAHSGAASPASFVTHIQGNVADAVKFATNTSTSPNVLFIASTSVIDAVRVFNNSGNNLTGGTIYVFVR